MIFSTCVISMWRNDIKCKNMFMFTLKKLACKGLRYVASIYHLSHLHPISSGLLSWTDQIATGFSIHPWLMSGLAGKWDYASYVCMAVKQEFSCELTNINMFQKRKKQWEVLVLEWCCHLVFTPLITHKHIPSKISELELAICIQYGIWKSKTAWKMEYTWIQDVTGNHQSVFYLIVSCK